MLATRVTEFPRKIKTNMTGQSGFLDSFLKFLEGDENGPMTKPVTTRKRLITSKKEETKPPGKVKRSPGRPRKNPEVTDEKEKEKLNCESEGTFTEKTNQIEALDSVGRDSQDDTKSPGKIKRPPGRPRKNPEVINIKEKEKLNCESEGSFTEKTNEIEALGSVDSDSQNDPKPPGKIKRPPGRPRKNPEVIDKKEKEKINCESEGSFAEKTNEIEALDSVGGDSQIVNRSRMLEVLRENFNKCYNEKVEHKETNGEGEVIEMKDLECVNESIKQNGESISAVRDDIECNAGDNKVNFSLNSGERKNSVDGASDCNEKEISNLTDKEENVAHDSASEAAVEKSGGRGRKRKTMTDVPGMLFFIAKELFISVIYFLN
ncbi:hypothetical protein J437_LFUL015507 [Ladona fulva]|uniref:Uncharacterized protein n=1 Tax=Ladona fulva TaxID=123851 RepID=A0A8K0KHE4_LADFU|nr:hypothetical protein J437_LFUL015507 [Ladona fulva]